MLAVETPVSCAKVLSFMTIPIRCGWLRANVGWRRGRPAAWPPGDVAARQRGVSVHGAVSDCFSDSNQGLAIYVAALG
ncbi:hypothetical protein GCM10009691_37870 [Brevibacterium picturae]|uniref:Uncharacterized protein n=1 Tax=Brevibacterium picturae TaxID=260553 RepID=A0ABP4NFY3_9MICO